MIAKPLKPKYDPVGYMPTQEEIRQAAEEIRKTWTPQQRAKRAGQVGVGLEVVKVKEIYDHRYAGAPTRPI